ncbi:Ig-like domain-containing protein [Agromyces sp. NPDC004153]
MPKVGRHRSALITAGAITGVVALVVGVAVVSGGYAAQRVDLGDASVWVVNAEDEAVGRANTKIHELNSVVQTPGSDDTEIVQEGSTVLVLDGGRANVDVLDATTSEIVEKVPVPPGDTTLALAGDRVVLAANGDFWSMPAADFVDFDAESDPLLTFGRGTVTSVDPEGVLFAFTPSTGEVARVDAAGEETVAARWQSSPVDDDHEVQITSIDQHWVVLDETDLALTIDGRRIDLSGLIGIGDAVRLQEPAADGDTVAIAHRRGLVVVDLDGGALVPVIDDVAGDPAAPVRFDGCLHAAWGAAGEAAVQCPGQQGRRIELGNTVIRALDFGANGDALVLNDRSNGNSWAASADYGLIDNWDALLETERTEEKIEENDPNTPPILEKGQVAPVAKDDELGARPGRSTILPVLLNDYDANGDVLVVDAVDGALPAGARIDRVSNNQQLQLTLDDGASGVLSFGYTVGDGRGASARAQVSVTVRDGDENSPPYQERENHAAVQVAGRVTTAVLGEWIDPDGDPFFLKSATTDGGDAVSSTAEGVVVFDERDGVGGERPVSLVVSDGRDDGSGELTVSVRSPGDVPLIAEPFVALATAGEEIRIDPLRYVHGGSGPARLSAVPAKPEVEITPDFDGGSFRFTSSALGTHLLEYSVTDGTVTATGTVRVDVSAPPDLDTTPITVPHTAFLRIGQPLDVDVLATDIDPTGGVLVVTGLTETAEDEGVRVEVVDHRILRVTLSQPLALGSTVIGYRVSNGLASADGTVTVVEVTPPAVDQPPVAVADTISARTGDVVDIPVLDNDEHPDGLPLTLAPDLVLQPTAGLLFAAGDRLRYFAPDGPGEYDAQYRVEGPDGQFATADVHISVREAVAETNLAPVPPTITARVLAGETVRIPIPLGGVDPDGDSVQLLAQESNPEEGAVVDRGGDWLEYQAGQYSTGTDTFQYSIIDALGARADGTIRVGIATRLDGARAPVAMPDEVTVRPGRSIAVRVLANDSDPDGGALSLVAVEPNDNEAEAEIDDAGVVRIEVPDSEGVYGFRYTIENERLGSASTFLTVTADDEAPFARPEASDTVLSLSDILDEEFVDVKVLRNVFLADGNPADLEVSLVAGYEQGADVRRDGSIRVAVQDERRIIPFRVTHPEDPGVSALAFIWVPGRDDALPQLRRDAPDVVVDSGEEVELDLEDYVIAASGRPVRITDSASVRASHSDGTNLVVDQDTLRFQSEPGYSGLASLSFTVTDGESDGDPTARTGTIVIPITVEPTAGQPPAFTGAVIDFEPGQSRTVDLLLLTNYPYADATDELTFRVLAPEPDGFTLAIDGQELQITADEGTPTGARQSVTMAVEDASGRGTPGRIELRVVPSTRPLAQPAPDLAIAARGRTTTIDVLANDSATNPFPGTPLRVVGVRGLDDSLPDGVSIVPSSDNATLTVDVSQGAAAVNTTLQYQVADATGDPSRYAWGTITISVQDRPEPVSAPQVTGFGDGTLDLVFGAGGFNNSPITGYEIALVDPASGAIVGTSTCAATTCTVGTPGNGQGNAVTVRVQARNAIGLSDPVDAPGPIWSDVIPPAPQGLRALPLDGRLAIEWQPVSTGAGSAVRSYVVTVAGVSSEVDAATCTATVCSTVSQGIPNGSQVPFTVSARNQAYPALAAWTEAGGTGTPFGPPIARGIDVVGDELAGSVTVSWAPFDGNGDAIGGYYVQRLADGQTAVPTGPQACSVTSPAPGSVVGPSSGGTVAEVVQVGPDASSVQFTGTATESTRYSFVVWGYNRAACVNTEVKGTVVRPAPGAVGGVDSRMDWMNAETWDRYIDRVDAGGPRLEIIAVDQNGAQIGSPTEFRGTGWLRTLLNQPFGLVARFQVRSCSVWGSCGPWSAILPSDAQPSLTFALPSRLWDEATGTWSWTAAPENSGLPAMFRCGIDGTGGQPRTAQTATTCQIPEAKPGDRVWLDVEVAGVVARYWNR